MNEDMIVGF